jgi:translocation and assembly module TamB
MRLGFFQTRTRLVAFTIAVLLVIGYAGLSIYLNSTPFRHKLLQQVNAAMDGQLSLGHHRLGLFSGSLALSDLRLMDAQGELLTSVKRLHLRLFWPALLWRNIQIKTVTIEDAYVALRYDGQDRLQRVHSVTPSVSPDVPGKGAKSWSLRIDDCRLSQGRVSFQRPAKGWSGTADGIKVAANINLAQQDGQVQISAGPLRWQQPEATYSLPTLKLTAAVDATQTITVKVQTPLSDVDLTGRLKWDSADPQIDMAANLKVELDEIQAWLPDVAALKGRIKAHLTAQGSLNDPTVAMDGVWTQAGVAGVPLEQVTVDLRLHQRRIKIATLGSHGAWGKLDLTGSVNLQPVFGDTLQFAAAKWDALGYDLKLRGENLQPARLKLFDFPSDGIFQLQADMTGGGLKIPRAYGQGHVKVQAAGLSLRQGAPSTSGQLSAELQWKESTIELKRCQATAGDNALDGTARINPLAGLIQQAQVHFQSGALEALGGLLGIQLPSGTGRVNLQCQGPWRRPSARIELLTQALVLGKQPLGRLLAEAQLNEQGVLHISTLVLENQGSLVEGNARLTLLNADGGFQADPGVDLDLAFEQLEPLDFGVPEGMGGNFKGRINLKGSLQHLTGKAVLEKSAAHWQRFAGQVQGSALWDDGRLTLSGLTLSKAASSVHLQGSAIWRQSGNDPWSATPRVQAEIQGQGIRLQDFFSDNSGIISLQGRVSGPAANLDGQFQLSGTELTIGGQPFQTITVNGRLSGGKVYGDRVEIGIQKEQTIKARGWYAFDRHFELKLEAADIGLNHIAALQQAYPIDGRLDLDLNGAGTLENPQMSANVSVRQPRLNKQPWDDFNLTAHVAARRLEVAAHLNFDLKANYQLDSGDFDLQAHFDRSDLSPYLAIWGGSDWGGVLSGRVQAKGNRYRPDQVQGELFIDNSVLRYQDLDLVSVPQLHARFDEGRLEVPASRLALLQDGFVNVSASGRPANLLIDSDGRLPLVALAPFLSAMDDARGEVLFQARAKGPWDEMQWQATVDISEVGFELPGLGQPVEALNGHLEITPRSLTVQDLSGRMDQGRFTLAGQMQLKQWQPVKGQLTLSAHALPLQWPDTMDVVINGDLVLDGGAARPALSGRLVLLEGSYYKDVRFNLLSSVTQTKRAVPVPSTYSVPESIGKMSLNVAVTHRYPLLVNNNLANLQVAPDLKISGTLANPILSGRAQVVEGEVIFRRKSFVVKRGVVDFINPYKIEPNLDIVAEARIRQWVVSLSLSGPPDQLVCKLSSDPYESENDILSLILLGRTGSEFAKGEGSGSQTTRQMLASLIATAWGEDVKKHSGVDILEVETGVGEDQASADRVQLTVGKRLSRRLTVKYEVASGSDESIQRAVSEYRFLEHLLASGFQDSKGGYGGELLFRLDF